MVPSFRWFKPLWCHVQKIVENWVSSLKVSSPKLNFVNTLAENSSYKHKFQTFQALSLSVMRFTRLLANPSLAARIKIGHAVQSLPGAWTGSTAHVCSQSSHFLWSGIPVQRKCGKSGGRKGDFWKKVVASSPSIFPVVRNSCTKEIFGASPHISFVQEFLTTGNMEGDDVTTFFRSHLSSLHYSHISFEQEFLTAGNVKIRKPPSVI